MKHGDHLVGRPRTFRRKLRNQSGEDVYPPWRWRVMVRKRLPLAILCFAGASAFGQTAETPVIKPGDNLVVEGVPPIPAALAEEVGRYTELRAAGFSSWHPT
ncbi:MAG: hypothetical protein ACRD00_00800, partial [Thermoanaerobaculia bacterium]